MVGTAARRDRAGRPGRPRIQETADRAVAELLARAGADVDGSACSTRALAERSGFSQTVVSRAIRRLAHGEGVVGGEAGPEGADSGEVARSEAASAGPARQEPAPGEADTGTAGARLRLTRLEVRGSDCRAEFTAVGADVPAPSERAHLRRRATLLAALHVRGAVVPPDLPSRLARAVEIPVELLAALADSSREESVAWIAGAVEPDRHAGRGDRDDPAHMGADVDGVEAPGAPAAPATAWLPRAGVSVTEQLAVRLRGAIMVSDLRPGDRLTIAECARLLEVPRSVASDVLRRMVDDELLDGTGGEVRIPLASADDVIELYAARMLLGDVLLRATAGRPRSHLLRARQVLSVIEETVAAGANVGDADLRFQQEVARASGLEQTVRLFESSTVRVQMLIALLGMDYARAGRSILADDRRILAALVAGDAGRAVDAWHRKTDAAVRHMHGQARHAAFDVQLWRRLTAL